MKMNFLWAVLVVGAVPVFFSSCDKDEEVKKSNIEFVSDAQEVSESDGTLISFHPDVYPEEGVGREIEIDIKLDRPLAETTIIKYSLSGTASDEEVGQSLNDYTLEDGTNTIVGNEQITITKGASEASIKLILYEDFELEINEDGSSQETIILELESIVSGSAVLATKTTHTMTVNEDDVLIFLQWRVDEGETHGDVDMDMYLWFEELEGQPFLASAYPNPEEGAPFEYIYIPAGSYNGNYGLSYTYYSGTSNNVDFFVAMWGNIDGTFYPYLSDAEGEFIGFTGNYTLQNINEWDQDSGTTPLQIQTLTKDGLDFSVSDITVPSTGSRSAGIGLNQVNKFPFAAGSTPRMIRKAAGFGFDMEVKRK